MPMYADMSDITPEMIAEFMRNKIGTINAITETVDRKATEKFELNKDYSLAAQLKKDRIIKEQKEAEERKRLEEEKKTEEEN